MQQLSLLNERTFYVQRTCTVNISKYLPEGYHTITRTIVAQMLFEENYLHDIDTIQISTCHRFISICFNSRQILLTYCEDEHQILPYLHIKFTPDHSEIIRISIENIPIELPHKEVKTFLSDYATPVGKTYYPGQNFHNKFYTTGTRVYHCVRMTQHLPRHYFHFNRNLRIRYDSQPEYMTTTNYDSQETLDPDKEIKITSQQNDPQTSEDEHEQQQIQTPIPNGQDYQPSDDETQLQNDEIQQEQLSQQNRRWCKIIRRWNTVTKR